MYIEACRFALFCEKTKVGKTQENLNSSKFLPKTQANGNKTQVFGKVWRLGTIFYLKIDKNNL